jgi:ferritin
MDPRLHKAINDQINAELYSAYLYYSMGAYFASEGLPGMTQWMKVQCQEEMTHADKFFDYLAGRGVRVVLEAIEKPEMQWDAPLAAFEAALKHEQYVTGRINDLVAVANEVNDAEAVEFLQWYVDEQEEEEESVGGVLEKLRPAGDDREALMAADEELGKRGS